MNSQDELYRYMQECMESMERDYERADELYYSIKQTLENMKWLKAELLDLIEKDSKLEKEKCSVYYILNADESLVKIGISKNVSNRIGNMQTSTGYYLELLNEIVFDSREEALEMESFLHKQYGEWRRKPHKIRKESEWFDGSIVADLMQRFDTKEKVLVAHKEQQKKMQESMNKFLG